MVLLLMRLPGVFVKLLLHCLLNIVPHYLQQIYLSAVYKTFTTSKATKHCYCVWCEVPEQRWNWESLWEDMWNIHKVTSWHLILEIQQLWIFSLCMQKPPTKLKNYCAVSLALITNDSVKKKGSSDENISLPRSLFHSHNSSRNGLQYLL